MPPSISTDRVGAIGERYNASYCATAPKETSLLSSRRAKIMHRTQRGHFRGSTDTQRAIFQFMQGAQQGQGCRAGSIPNPCTFVAAPPLPLYQRRMIPRRRAAPALAVARQPPPRRGRHLPTWAGTVLSLAVACLPSGESRWLHSIRARPRQGIDYSLGSDTGVRLTPGCQVMHLCLAAAPGPRHSPHGSRGAQGARPSAWLDIK